MNGYRAAALAALVCGAVAACSGSGTGVSHFVVTYSRGAPPATTSSKPSVPTFEDSVAWAGPNQIYVTTYGSGSCPRLPTSVKAHGSHEVDIHTKEHGGPACTSDLGPTTSTVSIPKGIDSTASLVVYLDGKPTTLAVR